MPEKSWEGLKAFSGLVAAVFIPLAVAFIGNEYSSSIETANRQYSAAIEEADRKASYIELAVGILSEEPTAENRKLRVWATDIINMYAEVKMDTEVARQLQTKVRLIPPEYRINQQVMDPSRLDIDRLRPNLRPRNP